MMMRMHDRKLEELSLSVLDQNEYQLVQNRVNAWIKQKEEKKYSFPLLIRTGYCLSTNEVSDFDSKIEVSGNAIDAYLSLLARLAPNVSFVGTEESMAFFSNSSGSNANELFQDKRLQFMEANTPENKKVEYVVVAGNKVDHFVTFVLVKSDMSASVTILDSLLPEGTPTKDVDKILQKRLFQKTFEQYLQESIGADEPLVPIRLSGIEKQRGRMCGVWTCHFAHQVALRGLAELKNIDMNQESDPSQIKLKTGFTKLLKKDDQKSRDMVFTRLFDILIQHSVTQNEMRHFFQSELDSMLRGTWKPLVGRSWKQILQSDCATFFINHMIQRVQNEKRGVSLFLPLVADFRDTMPSLLVFVWHNRLISTEQDEHGKFKDRTYTDGWKDLDSCWSEKYQRATTFFYSQLYMFLKGQFSAVLKWKYTPPLVKRSIVPFARLIYDFILVTVQDDPSKDEAQMVDLARCLIMLDHDFLEGETNSKHFLQLHGFPSDQKEIVELEQKLRRKMEEQEKEKKREDKAKKKREEEEKKKKEESDRKKQDTEKKKRNVKKIRQQLKTISFLKK